MTGSAPTRKGRESLYPLFRTANAYRFVEAMRICFGVVLHELFCVDA